MKKKFILIVIINFIGIIIGCGVSIMGVIIEN